MRITISIAFSALALAGFGAQATAAPETASLNDCKLLKAALAGTSLGEYVPHYGGHSTGCQYDDGEQPPTVWVTFAIVKHLSAADAHAYWLGEYKGWKETSAEAKLEANFFGPNLVLLGKRARRWGVDDLYWWHSGSGSLETISVAFREGRYYCELNLFEPLTADGPTIAELSVVLKKLAKRIPRS